MLTFDKKAVIQVTQDFHVSMLEEKYSSVHEWLGAIVLHFIKKKY